MSKYADIIERLEKATDATDFELELKIMDFDPGPRVIPWYYAPSIDAAMARVKRMLPDARMTVLESYDLTWRFVISMPDPLRGSFQSEGKSHDATLAILLALFRTLEAEEA